MKEDKQPKWYCYVCGKSIGNCFMLCAMIEGTDRVFLVHDKCSEQVDRGAYLRKVRCNP